jgi:hypothetical protein
VHGKIRKRHVISKNGGESRANTGFLDLEPVLYGKWDGTGEILLGPIEQPSYNPRLSALGYNPKL